ncbi:hypothetical protein NAA97_00460 [Listeria monocytogenes]|uniref:Lin1729 protein n=1 Tax=Listeria innocua serovar 6a (strain ATCC BAA-680 / CLIP 11262) TaxID=272626 RepID=Q92B22_LISIN|nr:MULTISPECIES: hypothetical protein [Listeria]YP_001468709.1 gp5 [Listeria phage B054]AWN07963.1 hypothetical protein [Listeria phage PSU-VKH-LP041]AAY53110.1 gp5 [Listeria phage B054]AGR15555.1 hypothetical protein M643_02940 [Listeria monocytogenes]EFK40515.1 hypothetical protein LMHG_12445 [Listeria monocytogenes FSL N1-017]EHJ4862169.1 hypothetical protein [Listeria monocytogenes]
MINYKKWLDSMMATEDGKILFERYKKLYGHYPPFLLDATEKEQWDEIKRLIKDADK